MLLLADTAAVEATILLVILMEVPVATTSLVGTVPPTPMVPAMELLVEAVVVSAVGILVLLVAAMAVTLPEM